MKQSLWALCFGFIVSCGDDADNSHHPVEGSLTDSAILLNDSVIVADTSTRHSF